MGTDEPGASPVTGTDRGIGFEACLVDAARSSLVAAPGGRPVPEGVASVVWVATLTDDPTGGFFHDGEFPSW